VSGINNDGHPTLRKSSVRNKTDSSLESSRTFNERILFATAALLVRHNEVIALAASGGNIIAMEGRMEETTVRETLFASREQHVSAVEFDLDGDDDGDSGNFASRISRIAGIVNPRREDEYNFPGDSRCMVLDSGKSHYRLYQDDKKSWEWFLKIQ
jgi:hypothetical protein